MTDITADPAGGVFVATRRGLARIDGDRVSLVPLPEGAPLQIRGLYVLPGGELVVTAMGQRAWRIKGAQGEPLGPPVGDVVTTVFSAKNIASAI